MTDSRGDAQGPRGDRDPTVEEPDADVATAAFGAGDAPVAPDDAPGQDRTGDGPGADGRPEEETE